MHACLQALFVLHATCIYLQIEPGRVPVPVLELEHPDAVSGVDIHPKKSQVCTSSADCNVRVWNVLKISRTLEPAVLSGHSGPVWSCRFSPSGAHIASTSSDDSIMLWDWQTSSRVGQLRGHTSWVTASGFDPGGAALCSASRDRSVRLWDLNVCEQVLELHGHDSWATCCALGGGGCLFSGGHDKIVRMWDTKSGMETGQFDGHVAGVYGIALSHDGHVIASASWDGTCRVWSLRMRKLLQTLALQARSNRLQLGGRLLVRV